MEKYLVIYKAFKDLEDNGYIYRKGDIYPREGLEPTKKRIKELTSNKNKIGAVLIEKTEEGQELEVEETEENEEVVKEELEVEE